MLTSTKTCRKKLHEIFPSFVSKHFPRSFVQRFPLLFFRVDIQPLDVFYRKNCFKKIRNIDRQTPVLEPLLNKVAHLKACNFIKKRVQNRRFPVNIGAF